MSIDELIEAIRRDTQLLDNAGGWEIEAISIEDLETILELFLHTQIKITQP